MKTKEQIIELREQCVNDIEKCREWVSIAKAANDVDLVQEYEKMYAINIHKCNLLIDILNG